jgi:outer membrane protein OmpA-like peptidoglycan-associated protein
MKMHIIQGIYFKFTNMKKIIFQILFLIVATQTFAQDARLSQIWSFPTMMNPAFSGKFDGSYRMGIGNSSQKSKLGAVNHQYGFVDSRFEGKATGLDRYFGLGVSYYQYGNASLTPINAKFVAITGAHHFNLSKDGVHSMGVGTQLAFASASASEKNGIYDKEINGGGFRWNDFNPNGTRNNVSNYVDWNTGIYYRYRGTDLNIELGAAGYHYLHPKNSLITYDAEHRLRGRVVFHSKVDININPKKILTFQNIFWTEGLYWVSRSLDKYNLVSNWGGLELSKAVPSDKIYINYGMYTRSFKTIMPYVSFISRNGFNLRASYEFPFNSTRYDAYTAKRFELSVHYIVGGNNVSKADKAKSSVPSRNKVIPGNAFPNNPPLNIGNQTNTNPNLNPPNSVGIQKMNSNIIRSPGVVGVSGMPTIDRDGDGLADNVDRCPDQPGPLSNQGCPLNDRDGDGVPDVADNCPDKPGAPTNGGCPDYNKMNFGVNDFGANIDTLKFNIYFDLDKYSLTQNSFEVLTSVIDLLKQNPDYKCFMIGHSDQEGSIEYNMSLSKNRAAVSKSYLMSYGVPERRIITKYVGETQPLPLLNRELGWMNRRVALFLYKSK